MNAFWTLLMLGMMAGFVLSSLLYGMIWMIRVLVRKLRPWVHLVDEEGGIGWLGRAKMQDGHIIIGKGDDVKRYPVRVEARSMTNQGILYTLGRQTGANMRVPRVASIKAGLKDAPQAILAFDVVDPGLLGRTYARRMAQETVDSQMEKEDWKKTAILPMAIVLGITVVGLVIAAVTFAAKSG
jgi:hypothetical protein